MQQLEHAKIVSPTTPTTPSGDISSPVASTVGASNESGGPRLSYKFQRMRERLRQAVITGELSGKLPGERVLARQFDANPKTISKALTDLAAEGLLDRGIGRGTYVKGARPDFPRATGRWLLLIDAGQESSPIVREIMAQHDDAVTAIGGRPLRPSQLNQIAAVIDLGHTTHEALRRDLAIRGMPMVRVLGRCCEYKSHAVQIDREEAAFCAARKLLLSGHRLLLSVEEEGQSEILSAMQRAAARYEPDAQVRSVSAATLEHEWSSEDGPRTAVICDGMQRTRAVQRALEAVGRSDRLPAVIAIACDDRPACDGYFVSPRAVANAVVDLLAQGQTHRPMTLWLAAVAFEVNASASATDMAPIAIPA